MRKVISLYCDESCHLEGNGEHVTMIGYIGVPHNTIKKHKEGILKLRNRHKLYTEIKWNKVSKSKSSFYIELLDYFLKSDMIFRGLIIPSGVFNHSHLTDDEYYKMFYSLLSHESNLNFQYNIYIDRKDSRSHKKVTELKEKLIEHTPFKINNLQTIGSHESSFIQLADIVVGAFAYDLNNKSQTISTKQILIEKLKSKFEDTSYEEYKRINKETAQLYMIALNNI